ncbi:MAG: rhodanese-like domain-containing protein [Acidobacteria bacterium]|nr:rhodanese-like domain-containing protein [Acidobacteriota bacterium]
MRNWMSMLTLNSKLALGAVALGAIALFATPYPGSTVTLDAKELALTVSKDADRVEAPELAAWIIEGRADYRLIDLRSQGEFAQYRIPGAVNVPMAGLIDAGLRRPEKLVLYAADAVRASQAWMFLRAKGYTGAYLLKGGLEAWKDQVVFPVLADNPTAAERTRDEKRRSMSAFFGGQPRSASSVSAGGAGMPGLVTPVTPALPAVAAPPSPMGGAPARTKKKEGC